MAGTILIPQDIAVEGKNYLAERGYIIKMGSGVDEESMMRDTEGCDAILLRTAKVTRPVIEAGKKLKIIARHGAGYDNVDLEAANEHGVWVTNTPDATTNSVAEFTIGAIIAVAKRTFLMSRALREGNFFYKNTHKGMDLQGKTLAIIGFGRIGSSVAKRAHFGLDMNVIAYTPHAKPEHIPEYVRLVSWEEAFTSADVISLHMPATNDNRGCVGTREFEMMKPSAYLVNCARGGLVDEAELIRAVEDGEIAGAFLDVYETEPISPENPLLKLDNVIATPHMASNTEECMTLMAVQAASQIHKVLSGEEPDWPVNRPVVNCSRLKSQACPYHYRSLSDARFKR